MPRELIMEGYETPRKMSALGGKRILEESPFLWMLYSHYDLRNVIRNIVGVEIYPCRHRKEFMVGNYLASSGSTHGWHLDDPAFALIVIFETPPVELGGSVELIPGWLEYCEDSGVSPEENVQPLVSRASEADLLKTKPHVSGDLYLLRADKSMHRVTGLLKDGVRRAALNLGFETTPRPEYGLTASILYEEG